MLYRVTAALLLLATAVFMVFNYAAQQKTYSTEELRQALARVNPDILQSFDDSVSKLGGEHMLRSYMFYKGCYGKDAIRTFAIDMQGTSTTPQALARVCTLLEYKDIKLSQEQRQYLDALSVFAVDPRYEVSDGAKQGAARILEQTAEALEEARNEGGKTWEVASRDMMSGMAYMALCVGKKNQSAWKTYCRHVDWMSNALMLLYLVDSPPLEIAAEENRECNFSEAMELFISLCGQYPSMAETMRETIAEWENAIRDDQSEQVAAYVPLMLEAYRHYGPQLEQLAQKYGISPKDSLNIIVLNKKARKDQLAEDIAKVYSNNTMWEAAKTIPEFLSLYHCCAPDDLDKVLQKYQEAPQGLCSLVIYAASNDDGSLNAKAAANLMRALAYYEQNALTGISQEGVITAKELPGLLAKDWRVPIFLKAHPQDGLSLLRENLKWLDKEYQESGEPRAEGSIGYLPFVGGILEVSINMTNGYPITWGEIGWAAWDVAEDIATVIAVLPTGGSGAVAVKGIGAAAKATGKEVGRNIVKTEGKYILKEGAEAIVKDVAKISVPKGGRFIDGWLVQGVKRAVNPLAKTGKVIVSSVWRTAVKTGKMAGLGVKAVYSRIGVIGVARLVAGTMICVDVCRFLFHAGEVAEWLTTEFIDILRRIKEGVEKGVTSGISAAVAQNAGGVGSAWNLLAAGVMFLVALYLLFPGMLSRQKKQHSRHKKIYSGV